MGQHKLASSPDSLSADCAIGVIGYLLGEAVVAGGDGIRGDAGAGALCAYWQDRSVVVVVIGQALAALGVFQAGALK